MISEQVRRIRTMADIIQHNGIKLLLIEAADTIETLSAKLAAANMERPDRYYGGGGIACEDGKHMPEEHKDFKDIFDPDYRKRAEELKEAAEPLVDYLYKYGTPHDAIVVKMNSVEHFSGEAVSPIEVRD